MNRVLPTALLVLTGLFAANRADAQKTYSRILNLGETHGPVNKRGKPVSKEVILNKLVVTRPGDTLVVRTGIPQEQVNGALWMGRTIPPAAYSLEDDLWLVYGDAVYFLKSTDIAAPMQEVPAQVRRYDRRRDGPPVQWYHTGPGQ